MINVNVIDTIIETDDIVKYFIDRLKETNDTIEIKKNKLYHYLFQEIVNITSQNYLEVTNFTINSDTDIKKEYVILFSNILKNNVIKTEITISLYKQDKDNIDEIIQSVDNEKMKDIYTIMKQTGMFYPKSGYISIINIKKESETTGVQYKQLGENKLSNNNSYLEILKSDVMTFEDQMKIIEIFCNKLQNLSDIVRYDLDDFNTNFISLMNKFDEQFNSIVVQ